MSLSTRVRVDTAETRRDLARLSGPQARAAVTRSLRRMTKSVRKRAVRMIFDTYNLPAARIRDETSTRLSGSEAALIIAGSAASLTDFRGTTQTPRGVSVRVKKKGGRSGRKIVKGAFLATMQSGHRGAFERKLLGGKRASRLPIIEKFGPAPQQALDGPRLDELAQFGRGRFEIELARDTAFRASRGA